MVLYDLSDMIECYESFHQYEIMLVLILFSFDDILKVMNHKYIYERYLPHDSYFIDDNSILS